jgi:hypothetical protein
VCIDGKQLHNTSPGPIQCVLFSYFKKEVGKRGFSSVTHGKTVRDVGLRDIVELEISDSIIRWPFLQRQSGQGGYLTAIQME